MEEVLFRKCEEKCFSFPAQTIMRTTQKKYLWTKSAQFPLKTDKGRSAHISTCWSVNQIGPWISETYIAEIMQCH